MSDKLRAICILVTMVAPWPLRRRLLCWIGYDIDPTARIGLSFVNPGHLRMGPRASIGHLTFIAGMDIVEVSAGALLGNLNWITGLPQGRRPSGFKQISSLRVGREASITNRHYIDVQDDVEIGEYTTMAGVRSTILSHGIDVDTNRQQSAPVTIGAYCMLGSGVIVLPGAQLGDRVVLAAGGVVPAKLCEGPALYAGVPARQRKQLSGRESYFNRIHGRVE